MKKLTGKVTLIQHLENYLRRERKWIHGERITKFGQSLGYEGETARRRVRELMENGKVETQSRMGKTVRSNWYRWI